MYDLTTHEWTVHNKAWGKQFSPETIEEALSIFFCNNNRLFVFLAYMNRFVDGRELKGKTAAIGEKINSLLDNLTMNDFHSVHYHYDKEADLVGDYTALSLSTIYYE